MSKKRVERLQIMLNDAELAAIDDWRFKQRMPSRAAAVRAMIHIALARHPSEDKNRIENPSEVSSKDVGVLEADESVKKALGTADGRAILLVECDDLIREGLIKVARNLGLTVEQTACSASEIEDALNDCKPELALVGSMESLDQYRHADHLLKSARVPCVFCFWQDPDPEIISFFNKSVVVQPPNLLEELERALAQFLN